MEFKTKSTDPTIQKPAREIEKGRIIQLFDHDFIVADVHENIWGQMVIWFYPEGGEMDVETTSFIVLHKDTPVTIYV